ncbi:MAG: thioredoxin family protein [Myxococcota bacterium]
MQTLWLGLALGLGACRAPDVSSPVAEASERVAVAAIGQPAPDFALKDLDGKEHRLSSLKGKTVVLEWFNPGCPYVKYAHGEGALAKTPGEALEQGVVWLAINSGAPGKQGHGVAANKQAAASWSMAYPVLLDEDGAVGRAYDAKTTPHVYVVDAEGVLVYRGALDNRPLGEGGGEVVNYVAKALGDLAAGKPVATPETKPYGCSVKY